ncbi:MAG: class I SAM-dependent methyltransferase [Bryobacteraceae bacterium]|jgi:predicted O-methyltransferase YrrM
MSLPKDLESAIDSAWDKARDVPGYIGDREFRALAMLFAGAPRTGAAVEIGSFKGKSTVGLAALAARYGLDSIVSIDPHNAPSATDPELGHQASSFDDFRSALKNAGVEQHVEIHRAPSQQVAAGWNRPIGFLWIDGDHTYAGAKLDFDLFFPYLVDGAIVAIHDTLHEFEGPIRVFVEQMLRSDQFGPAGLLHTIGWAQYSPRHGSNFCKQRERLARSASRLIPLVADGRPVTGLAKMRWKLLCALIPHSILSPTDWESTLSVGQAGSLRGG